MTAIKGQETLIGTLEKETKGLEQEALVGSRTIQDVVSYAELLAKAKQKLGLFLEKQKLLVDSGYYTDLYSTETKEELQVEANAIEQFEKYLTKTREIVEERRRNGELTDTDSFAVQGAIDQAKLNHDLIDAKLRFAPLAAKAQQRNSNLDIMALVRTSLVRFGGVGVILFLISILVPIYRYNVRLATFYLARADSLTLSRDVRVDDFGQLTNLLTPVISFDKEPKTPIDTVSSLVKDAASLAKKA